MPSKPSTPEDADQLHERLVLEAVPGAIRRLARVKRLRKMVIALVGKLVERGDPEARAYLEQLMPSAGGGLDTGGDEPNDDPAI